MAEVGLLGAMTVDFDIKDDRVLIVATARSRDGRPVQLVALTACTVAALTIYDMCKAVDRSMRMEGLELVDPATA